MPAHKSLLVSASVVLAGRARKCYHNPVRHRLAKGDPCLEVKVNLALQGYCLTCAREMIRVAREDLDRLVQVLDGHAVRP